MCTIISIHQQNKKDDFVHKAILNQIWGLEFANSDGVGILSSTFDNENFIHRRTLKINFDFMEELLKKNDLINMHLRTKTTGEVNIDNIHFWSIGEWYFAHNGLVFDYSKEAEHTDSYMFFKDLVKTKCLFKNGGVDYNKIEELKTDKGFSGRFILMNRKSCKVFYFGDFVMYLLNKHTLLISSQSLNFTTYKDFFGIYFPTYNPSLEVSSRKIDGLFIINYQKGTHRYKENKRYYGYGGYH